MERPANMPCASTVGLKIMGANFVDREAPVIPLLGVEPPESAVRARGKIDGANRKW